jgi:phenylacetate-coenzyme A ligase PaaK-like adenylate-forming protein
MPLIRYLNRDIIELQHSNGGHKHLRISNLEGRVMDQLLRSDGTRISSALAPHLVYKSGAPVWKYQVVQTDYGKIVFHYSLRDGEVLPDEMRNTLTSVFRRYLGDNLQVEFVVGGFETSKSGKHRFVINRVFEQANTYAI